MKLKYLLAGMLLLTPLASQAFKGKGMAVVPPARPPVPCKGQGCVKEAPNSGRVNSSKAEVKQIFGNPGAFQTVGETGRSGIWQKIVASFKKMTSGVAFKAVSFFFKNANAQEDTKQISLGKMNLALTSEGLPDWNKMAQGNYAQENTKQLSLSKMNQALTNAAEKMPDWNEMAQGNYTKFMEGTYPSPDIDDTEQAPQILRVMKDIWPEQVKTEEDARKKLVEIQESCAI